MKILKKTLTGLGLFVFLMGFILLTGLWGGKGQYFFDALIIAAMAVSVYEMVALFRRKNYNVSVIPVAIVAAAAYPLIKLFGFEGLVILFAAGFLLEFFFFIFDLKVEIADFLATIFVTIYPLFFMSLALSMINSFGMMPFLVAIGAAMMEDVIAFYFGSLIKGPKIFPRISPKKTWSGSIAGVLGGAAGAIVAYAMFEVAGIPVNASVKFSVILAPHPYLYLGLIGAGIAIVSELGDIAASRLKRKFEIKDFSNILGSHGGLMDRLDSILFAMGFMTLVMQFIV